MSSTPNVLQYLTINLNNGMPAARPLLGAEADADRDGQAKYDAVALPPLRWSTLSWLSIFGAALWHRYHRCCSLLLLVDLHQAGWGLAGPPQEPRHDGVAWQVPHIDPNGSPGGRAASVGGSFQLTRCVDPAQGVAELPAYDGLHLLFPVDAEDRLCWCYLKAGGEVVALNHDVLIFDDWSQQIEQVIAELPL